MEKEALNFATAAHRGQIRKYTQEPYIEHPKRVAALVKTVAHTPEMLAAAYLHDVVEDTEVSIQDIKSRFGSLVAQLVEELTDQYEKANYPDLNRKARKERTQKEKQNVKKVI